MGDLATGRIALSNLGRFLSSRVCRVPTSDPMSGFFIVTANTSIMWFIT